MKYKVIIAVGLVSSMSLIGCSANDTNNKKVNDNYNNAGDNAVEDLGEGLGNGVEDLSKGVGNGVEDLGKGVGNGIEDVGDGLGEAGDSLTNSIGRIFDTNDGNVRNNVNNDGTIRNNDGVDQYSPIDDNFNRTDNFTPNNLRDDLAHNANNNVNDIVSPRVNLEYPARTEKTTNIVR